MEIGVVPSWGLRMLSGKFILAFSSLVCENKKIFKFYSWWRFLPVSLHIWCQGDSWYNEINLGCLINLLLKFLFNLNFSQKILTNIFHFELQVRVHDIGDGFQHEGWKGNLNISVFNFISYKWILWWKYRTVSYIWYQGDSWYNEINPLAW